MKSIRIVLVLAAMMLISGTSFANMKKGKVASEGIKTFGFSTSADGPCVASLIFDSTTADLDAIIATADTGDVLCLGISTQKNFDACTAGLPPGDYLVAVSSFKGASVFRLVVGCGDQQSISAAGADLREVEENSTVRKMRDQVRKITYRKK